MMVINPNDVLGRDARVTVICNPISGARNAGQILSRALRVMTEYGWQVDMQLTAQAGDAKRLATQAREQGQDLVMVAGGDGTLNEVTNALVNSPVVLGTLPTGTANVWARQMGLPVLLVATAQQLAEAARLQCAGRVRTIDVGRADDRYFLLWSGIGLDAEITAGVEPRSIRLKRLGIIGYGAKALWIGLRYRGIRMSVHIDDRRVKCRALIVLISNTQLYGAFVRAAPAAILDDGLLDIGIFKGRDFFEAIGHAVALLLGRARRPQVIYLRGQRISVSARRQVHVHVDGEPIGYTPITFEVVPHALRVLVPMSAPAALFTTPSEV